MKRFMLKYIVRYPRHADRPRAQARKLLPDPVAPVISTLSPRPIKAPSDSRSTCSGVIPLSGLQMISSGRAL